MNSTLMYSNWGRRLGKRLMKQRLTPPPKEEAQRWNIVRGDNVQVIQGPQTGQKGKILNVLRDSCRVIVEGVNMVSSFI
jgi:transcription antitermination factor NusG